MVEQHLLALSENFMGRQCQLIAACLCALAIVSCDSQASQQAEEPPEWVKEAHERSRKQRQAKKKPSKDPAPAPVVAPVEESPLERPLLWRVEGDKGPLYLFGTVHGGIADLNWRNLPTEVREAIKASDTVVLEADNDKIDPQTMRKMAMLPRHKSLENILGEKHFRILVRESNFPPRLLRRLKPWAAYMMVTREGLGEGRAVDEVVKIGARVEDKKLEYLETVNEQLELIRTLYDIDTIRTSLEQAEYNEEVLARMLTAYRKGDAQAMEQAAFRPKEVLTDPDELEKFEAMNDKVFTHRNRNWIPKLERLMQRGPTFVAVGAGHLVGDNSVNKRLEQKGHDVVRVPAHDNARQAESESPQGKSAE